MNLIEQNIAILNDAKLYLQALSKEQYTTHIELMSGGTLGQHTRHFIEFYQCLLNQACLCEIDYDARQRNLLIESNPQIATSSIDEVIEQLATLDLSTETVIKICNSTDYTINSTLGRELLYNLEHCIHHLALIKIGLKIVAPNITLPKHFGFAPSTILHQKQTTHNS